MPFGKITFVCVTFWFSIACILPIWANKAIINSFFMRPTFYKGFIQPSLIHAFRLGKLRRIVFCFAKKQKKGGRKSSLKFYSNSTLAEKHANFITTVWPL